MATELLEGTVQLFCGKHITSRTETYFGGCVQMNFMKLCAVLLAHRIQEALVCILHLTFVTILAVILVSLHYHNSGRECRAFHFSLHSQPKLYSFTAVLSTAVSLTNLGIGLWFLSSSIANEGPTPLHDWVFHVIQGLAWIVIAMSLKLNLPGKPIIVRKVWWVATFICGTFLCTMSALEAYKGKHISLYTALNIASLPVCFLLLVCALKKTAQHHSQVGQLSDPLLDSSTSSIENENATLQKRASCFSRATFSWLGPLLHLGYSRPLEMKDISPLAPEDQSELNYEAFTEQWKSQKNSSSRKKSIFLALGKCYWKDIVCTGFLAFCRATSITAGPLLLRFFVDFTAGKKYFRYEGYVLVVGLFLAKTIESFSQRHWYFGARCLGMKVRSALIAAVYEKELHLSNSGKHRHATGEIVNYIGVDAYRIGEFPWWLHWIWVIPLQLSIAVAIFFSVVGLATLPGLFLILLTILFNAPIATSLQKFQGRFMAAQDERLRATTEILNSMKVIKLQGWENKFKDAIYRLREREFHWLEAAQITRSYGTTLYWISPIVVGSVILFACTIFQIPLTPTIVFTVLATFRIIQEPIRMAPDLLATVIQVRVSLHRLNDFLLDDELEQDSVEQSFDKDTEYAIRIDDGVWIWNPEDEKPTLKGINMNVRYGEKIAVCGAIGSGKSSLLHSILGEIPKLSGTVKLCGNVAYVAQTAWIQTGTIKDNILFGLPWDEDRYKKSLQACALEQDLSNFPHRDLTEIGERGINMSGGQKQRIQLARAVYNNADIYLLDDPFSAVDAHTASTLFHDCVLGALANKTVVLVTHQVEFLNAVDFILVMHEGEIKQAGTYEQLLAAGETFHQLVTAHQEALTAVSDCNDAIEDSSNFQESLQRKHRIVEVNDKQSMVELSSSACQLIQEEEREIGNMGIKPYNDYINVSRGSLVLLFMVLGQATFVATNVASNLWLAKEVSNPTVSGPLLVGVYAALSIAGGVFVYMRSRLCVVLGLKASKAFFNGLMNSLIKAPMSFFDSTPSGRILNRASSDLSVLDLDIPFCFGFVMAGLFELTGILIVISLVTWQILIVAIPMLFIIQKIQRFYLTSSRELMRLNATSKAPIVNSSSETISGAVTIRAFKMVERFKQRNMKLVDHDASLYFHTQGSMEWLALRLEALGSIVLCATSLLLVLLPADRVTPGFSGLSISYALAVNSSQVFLVWWQCNFGNYIISVERIKQYMHLPKEAPDFIENNRPVPEWPSKGKVSFEKLQIQYRKGSPLVLQDITCTIEGGQKVGVVGRTGSGKTTLVSAIFRLIEPAGGRIYIDDIDICTIGLHDLRLRLGIIPQEPVLFRGTVRTNIDPLNQYTDAEVWETLKKCQLEKLIWKMPNRLESPVCDEGENWSAGQRQLFCLGRVLLKHSKILVLDEATASIDSSTDAVLQNVIREEFADCTVITVAHRIPTVINSDMVLTLHDGFLAEFDRPMKLMEDTTSLFSRLVAEYWAQSSHGSRHKLSQSKLRA